MSDFIETAVFSEREGAGWTGLGMAIPKKIARDPAKIAALCGATYSVQKQPIYFFDAIKQTYIKISGREALIRSDNNEALEVVSDNRYHVLNRQPIDVFEAHRDELAKNNLEISHAMVLKGGAIVAVCATLPPDYDINVKVRDGVRDSIKSYTTLSTGYDKRHGSVYSKSDMRAVCWNTLMASIGLARDAGQLNTIRASTMLEVDSLSKLMGEMDGIVRRQRILYNKMANAELTTAQVKRFFANVIDIKISELGEKDLKTKKKLISTKSENILAELVSAYQSGPGASLVRGTVWGALNAVTYYATHKKTVRDMNHDGAMAARVASNMFGDASQQKLRALALASEMVAA